MKISKEILKELVGERIGDEVEGFVKVKDETIGTRRWSIDYEMIIQDTKTSRFYQSCYSCGATEQQEERPYDDERDEVEVTEVFPREVVVVEYVTEKEPS